MLNYITLMQIIGCILVIFGHSYPFVTDVPMWLYNLQVFIYTFHMPLFVFCSGYLLRYTKQAERYRISKFISKRAKRILIPYFVFSIIGILPKMLFSRYLNDPLSLSFTSIIKAFLIPRDNIWGHFWFLPMIFFMGVIGFCIDKVIRRNNKPCLCWMIVSLVSLAFSFVTLKRGEWLGINDILLYFWYFAVGETFATVDYRCFEQKSLLGVGLVLFSAIFFRINLTIGFISFELINKLTGIFMIFGIMLICIDLQKKISISEDSILRQTYTIFILSWPCQLVCEIILERLLHLSISITMPMQFICGSLITVILIRLIDIFEKKTKTHFLSFCLGR